MSTTPIRWPGHLLRLVPVLALSLAGALAAQHELAVTGVPANAPLRVSAWADPARLVVDLELQPGWHAYARDVGGGEPVSLRLAAGGVRAVGPLRLPPDEGGKLHGRVRIVQWIAGRSNTEEIAATLGLMVCDPLQCLPPIEVKLTGRLAPVRVLLVASAADEHRDRIREFLRDRGFAVKAATYDEVDLATCDAHDVILAASKLFREDGPGGGAAASFPKTKTPIVAVGFLGTRLIENHDLAMTSGYI